MDNEKWAFTFGTNHVDSTGRSLGSVYVVIEGNYGEARDKLVEARGDKWAFQYPASEMKYQEALFGISEVPLENVITINKERESTVKKVVDSAKTLDDSYTSRDLAEKLYKE